ncbi:MAG: hypothetical protein HQK51_12195 [Oligoflexia bacterium]|nr:hypothetical protein [Oligoflexia bacterium]
MDKKKKSISLGDILKKDIKGSNPLNEREDLKVALNDLLSLNSRDEINKSGITTIHDGGYTKSNLECADAKKTDNNWITNGKQLDNKQVTNGKQLDNKQVTNGKQLDNKQVTENIQLDNKQVTVQITNGKQLDNNWITSESFYTLSGLQRSIVQILYNSCRSTGQATTSPISNIHFQQITRSSYGSIKTTIMRLRTKNVVRVVKSKCGQNGWAIYKLHKDLYGELYQNEQNEYWITNGKQLDNKQVTVQITDQITNASSSSSINNILNTTTTTSDLSSAQTNDPWSNIQTPEVLRNLGFGKNIIDQVKDRNYLTPEKLQESLDNLACDISINKLLDKKPGISVVRYFMGATKKGQVWIAEGFQSPEDEALNYLLKQKEQAFKKRKEIEQKFKLMEFDLWLSELPDEKKRSPEFYLNGTKYMGDIHMASLKGYFETEIWPAKWEQIKKEIQDTTVMSQTTTVTVL